MQVVLGRGNGYGRLLKFVRFYRRAFHDRAATVARVDLRYSNGFAVRWKQTGKRQ
jgi:cell division protein FtsQ